MVISWYGEGCFKIQNGETVVLTDLPEKNSGITAPRIKPAVQIKTISGWPFPMGMKDEGDTFTIHGAGEYDHSEVAVKGWNLPESTDKYFKTIYKLTWDDITIGLLGHVSGDIPPQLLESFEEIDVIIAPGGGEPFISQEKVIRLIKQLNPKIFIPSFIKTPGLVRKAAESKELAASFDGGKEVEPQEKFVFKKKDIQDIKKTNLIVLKV